ncbi:hypothetical protein HH310_19160 [Actinoplanes sp. TBRC 11911]|uniref:hypothetical protein n=1 Tax=Actinoplanes sp. TBRC 11911 TaxID=2729386 RepID=UPI00145EEAD1|nr:hypothetical protein [Actinoplanes sp. TBRC 11911]NMO53304.1 hypothetical protein [Actinoplanes sp. TBRC 11911]
MLTDVDLPAPGLLWPRWVTLAASLTGIGWSDVWYVDDEGAHYDDHGGTWARFALLDGARAVLFGYDREHSATADADPPIDLLTGAPSWLPWDALTPLAESDRLGFVVWHEQGRWSRVRYRDGVGDGLVEAVGAVLSGENAMGQLTEIIAEWGRHELDTPQERDEVRAASEQMLAAAVRGVISANEFERLLGRVPALDLKAALFAAGRGGVTAGTRPPRIPAGVRPTMRRVRRLSRGEHDRLIWAAMQDARELDRMRPPHTDELDALVAWMRESAVGTVMAYSDATSVSIQGREADQQLSRLLSALRRAEADPRHGSWLFLLVETTATDVRAERHYDSWPPWWPDDEGPWRSHLVEEMDARDPRWRPGWTRLLDPSVAYKESSTR